MKDGQNQPMMDPNKNYVEINGYVIFWGLFFACLFALAVGYLALKIGQTVDAFAPVSIMAMGMAILFKRKNAFPETVHIQAIASAGTNILGGAIFILPAFFIVGVENKVSAIDMMIPLVFGGLLGVLISAIFRRYFCVDMHNYYNFPAGKAAAEVLTSNESSKAKLMLGSAVIALIYDVVLNTFGWWEEVLRSTISGWGQSLAKFHHIYIGLDSDAALLGLGYFTGLRYAAIIAAGSFFSYIVVVPIVYFFGGDFHMVVAGKDMLLADAPIKEVFNQYVRLIGIGMLAMAGIIGLLSMSSVVFNVAKTAISDMTHKNLVEADTGRTNRDIPMNWIVFGIIVLLLAFTVFFHFTFSDNLLQTVIVFVIISVFSILLSVVGISSIAFTGNEPVSGLTIFMIIVSAVILGLTGMHGQSGVIAILMMAAFLCATLGVAGNFMSELKVSYLTGATPKKMEQWQLVSVILSGIIAVGVVVLLNNAYGYVGPNALQAPQANAMAAITVPLMEGGSAPWPLYICGAFLAVLMWMIKVPPLAFALGAYLPIEINTPLLVGGIISYLVTHSSKSPMVNEMRDSRGNTIASGLVAGGAIGSLISAVLKIGGVDVFAGTWVKTAGATYLGIFMYALLCLFLGGYALHVTKKNRKEGEVEEMSHIE